MSFQVSINDGTSWIALSDEPMGLVDANIKIYRDEQFSGIVSNIVSDLSFWGWLGRYLPFVYGLYSMLGDTCSY